MNVSTTDLVSRPHALHPEAPAEVPMSAIEVDRPSGTRRQRHLFVDNVRFWSMFSVVAVHSTGIFFELGQNKLRLVEVFLSPLRFGTIGFFLISGFLIGRGTETSRPIAYLLRRLKKVFIPWLCWYLLFLVMLLGADLMHHRIHLVPVLALLHYAGTKARYCFFNTAFWFVPNLLLSLCLLMLFKRYLQHRWFGALLLAINLFYVVNIYERWVPSSHTEAMLGFVFYLWLGTYACRRQARFEQWVARLSMAFLLSLAALFAFLSYGETILLDHLKSPGMNTLRLSNQLFSIAAVLVLYKLRSTTWPSFVDVRNNTFGIYLIHSPLLLLIWPLAKCRFFYPTVLQLMQTRLGSLLLWIVVTAVAYFVSLVLTKAISSHRKLRWLVGVDAQSAPSL